MSMIQLKDSIIHQDKLMSMVTLTKLSKVKVIAIKNMNLQMALNILTTVNPMVATITSSHIHPLMEMSTITMLMEQLNFMIQRLA